MRICPRGSRWWARLVAGTVGVVGVLAWLLVSIQAAEPPVPPWEIPVLVVRYFPVAGDRIDLKATGDWGESLAATREKTERVTREVIQALEEGSRYHGYKDPAAVPSLRYRVVETLEFLEPLPVKPHQPGKVPMTDYRRIMERVGIRKWVEERGVREVWLWGYHGGKVELWESNMASPFGDVSNSDRNPDDLPVLSRTYTVYHYNYQRGTSEAVEDHMHQIEALLNAIDGRDRTPPARWGELLFWGRFVGSDASHKIVTPRCGWAHYPPNAKQDYDWANPRTVMSDIEDWRPDGTGRKQPIDSRKWGGNSLRWFVYWMQNLPGQNHGLTDRGRRLTNWWVFVGDYDSARKQGIGLVE